jgi:beta-phosphoglucomutase-like phosphatase (HAD superfamily)
VTEPKCIELVREYYQSSEFLQAAPFPGVPEALEMASSEGKVFLVSARQWYAREATETWLEHYNLSRYADDLVLCNSFSADGSEVPKADMLLCLGASVLIDDSEATLREAMERGVGGRLCVQRGLNTWSGGSDLPKCHDLLDGVSQIFNLGHIQ